MWVGVEVVESRARQGVNSLGHFNTYHPCLARKRRISIRM